MNRSLDASGELGLASRRGAEGAAYQTGAASFPSCRRLEAARLIIKPAGLSELQEIAPVLRNMAQTVSYEAWDEHSLRALLERPEAFLLCAKQQGEILGAVAGGSLGVRGLLCALWLSPSISARTAALLILEALDRFRQIGPRRVHVLTHTSGWEVLNSCPALRFAQPPGEKLLECSVEKFFARKFRLTGYEVRALAAQDIAAVTNSLSDMPEVAFERWEPHLAQHNIGNANCAQFVAFSGDELIGVVLGGVLGSRATITHTWVKEGCRTRGLGHHLAYAAVTSMEHQGAKDLHLMLAAGNEKVQPFWESMGFKEKAGHIFLECDL